MICVPVWLSQTVFVVQRQLEVMISEFSPQVTSFVRHDVLQPDQYREREVDWQWAELWASEQDDGSHVTCGGRWRARQRRSLIKDELMRTNNLHRVDGSKFPLPALTCCSVKHGGPTPPDVLVLDVCVRMLRVGLRHHDGVALDWLSTHCSSLQSVFYSVVSTDLSTSSITAPAHGDITGGRGHRCRS